MSDTDCDGGYEGCLGPEKEEHMCPFKQDIEGDEESLCNCCDSCRQICVSEICVGEI